MITGELKTKIDRIWEAFSSGGISNPLEVIEQITYLLFIRPLDDIQTREENRANRTGRPVERTVFPEGTDKQGRPWTDLRWSRFKDYDPATIFEVVGTRVFPFLRTLGVDGSTYSQHMEGARFTIPTPALLAKVVDMLAAVMQDRDTNADLYEYMLGKIATAEQNGQFRTPRHIIGLMVELTEPSPHDVIVDPAAGTSGFLVSAGEHVRRVHPRVMCFGTAPSMASLNPRARPRSAPGSASPRPLRVLRLVCALHRGVTRGAQAPVLFPAQGGGGHVRSSQSRPNGSRASFRP